MKINFNLLNRLAVSFTVMALAATARAGIFTWSAPVAITTADATLGLPGTVVGSAGFGTESQLVVLSNGALFDFKADNSVAYVSAGGGGTAFGAFTNDTGNAAFNIILTQCSQNGGPQTITINNLVLGQEYSVQLFAVDRRPGVNSSEVGNFQDPNDNSDVSANFQMGDNVYVVGTFIAPATTVNLQENLLNSGNGTLNALVVRAIGGTVAPQITTEPQPATIYNGQVANFTAPAVGSGPLTWHWQKGNVGGTLFTNLVNGGRITGATNYSLTISNLSAGDTADYQVVVTNAYGSVTSSPAATLTVQAGTPQFAWSSPAPITTADGTLNQTGTIVGAEVFGSSETIVTLTNHSTVDFKADGSVAYVSSGGNGNTTGAFLDTTGNANFDAVLNQFTFDGGPDTITLNNLFVGQQYAVQLFALDQRAGAALYRQANFQDPNDAADISPTFQMGDTVYTIGTFTASSTSVNIQENLLTGGYGNLNAVVIRALGVIVAPQISAEPQPVTIDQGLTTSFTVAASGTTPLSYRWQRGVVGSGVFTNVPANSRYVGLTSPTLTINNLNVGDTADYQVIVANAAGSVTSTPPATLTVQAVTPQYVWSVPAAITTADATLNQAGTVVGAATFGATPAIVVLTNGSSIFFSTNATVAAATGNGTATGAFSGNTSNSVFNAILNAFNYDNGPKQITVSNLVSGRQYAVQLFALENRSGLTTRQANFQDPNDGYDYSDIFNLGDNVYTIATFTASGATATIQENLPSGGNGNINALVVRQLSGLPLAPVIVAEPVTTAVYAGSTAQLTVAATGTALQYQWQSAPTGTGSFSKLANGGNVSGATSAQLTITSASAANAADYRVIVSNGSGSVTSSPNATLTIRNTAANLIHRWNFNETSGTIAHDSAGTANGTLVSGTGTSASFNGTGQVVLNNPGLETTGAGSYVAIPGGLVTSLSAVTFELWYNNTGLNNGNPWISFGGPVDPTTLHGTNFINFFARWSGSTTAFQIQSTAGDSGVVTLGARQQSGTFHWVAIYDPVAGTVSVYLNGNLQASASGIHIPLSTVGTSVGYIGYTAWNQVGGNSDPNLPDGSFSAQYGFNGNGNYPYLNANVDEVRIYDGALNTNAIAATQLLGPNTLLSNTATLSALSSAGSLTLVWPIVNGGFTLESSAVLGANAVWTTVPGTKTVVGTNYELTVSSTNAAAFYRLRQ
jgi:hypothetical protein